jgi:hypothetical protein
LVGFDKICKRLLLDLGSTMGFRLKDQFPLDPQALVERITGYTSLEASLKFSIDVAWLRPLSYTGGYDIPWISDLVSDIVVAWEVDAGTSHKAIRSSIDNLATLNPRLGIEWILIGGNEKAVKGFERRFKTATQAARIKPTRIIVIHDVIFSQLYYLVKQKHPKPLYDAYLQIAEEKGIKKIMKQKWNDVLNTSKNINIDFKEGIKETFIKKL